MSTLLEKPDTMHKKVDQLWDHLLGNGTDGVLRKLEAKIANLNVALSAHLSKDGGQPKLSFREILKRRAVDAVLIGIFVGGSILLALGIISPDDIAKIIGALRSGGG